MQQVLGFTVSAGRRGTTVSCDPGRTKTCASFPSVLFRTKSNCLALFSAFSGAQECESKIQLEIKFGEQPFPKQNSISLNVSRSPISSRQKAIRRYFGHLFRAKKASPFKVLKSFVLSSNSSVSRYPRSLRHYSESVGLHSLR